MLDAGDERCEVKQTTILKRINNPCGQVSNKVGEVYKIQNQSRLDEQPNHVVLRQNEGSKGALGTD